MMIAALVLGLLAGLLARALMPGADGMSWLATLGLGLVGALIGWLLFSRLLGLGDGEMFDLGGLVGATAGACLLLWVLRHSGTRT